MLRSHFGFSALLAGGLAVLTLAAGCGGSTNSSSSTGGSTSTGGSSGSGGAGTGASAGSGASAGTGASAGSGGAGGSGGSAGGPCTTDQDCPNGMCGFPAAAACAAKGQCFPPPQAVCNGYSPGCACDGSVINIVCTGLPDGYVSQPLLHPGQCEPLDAGVDACDPGVCLSGQACNNDADCAALGTACDPCAKLCACGGGTSFSCGTMSCDSATQYCKVASGGPCCNPPSYSCEPIPPSCNANHSCACIQAAVGAQQCSESGGGVTVDFFYP